ncbi:MAG TPA: type II toxin-antitoxin system VapC family toxin [Solirubrobacterales bacterium]|nr:type II toxin-antitoxin system VapC family toxin [Solirubrobacterales bacterium]
MILDTSVIVALLIREPGYEALERKVRKAGAVAVGSPTLLETAMVMIGVTGEGGRAVVDRFRADLDIAVIPFGARHGQVATDAFLRFGKGRHPAALNILDCMTYATARVADESLLFTGNDFAQTDIQAA